MASVDTSAPRPHRVLVVLGRPVRGQELRSRLKSIAGERPLEMRVLAPAFADSLLEFIASDIDPGMRRARGRLAESIVALGPVADDQVGESDPLMAIDTALVEFPAEEIVIIPSSDRDQWAEAELFEHVCERFELSVREFELREDATGTHAIETACSHGASVASVA